VANDKDLHEGLLNLEEILHRLDARAKSLELLKERAPRPAPDKGEPMREEPQLPKTTPPEATPPAALPAYKPEPVAPYKRIEIPEFIPPVKPVAVPPPAPVAAPPVIPPPVKAPEPAVKAPEPAKIPEKAVPPPAEPKAVIKPAKKAFVLNKTVLIFFCLGLAIAGGAYYQLTVNSAKARYAQAGKLVKSARLAEAVTAYTRITEVYKGSPEAAYSQYAIGDIKSVQGDLHEAINRYEKFLLAAPDKDAKVPQAKFNIAEIEFKQNNYADAEFMYNNPDIKASAYAKQAADRVIQIKAVKAQAAEARKLMARDPARAAAAFSALLTAYPGLKAAADGLAEAQAALAAANTRKAARAVARAKANRAR